MLGPYTHRIDPILFDVGGVYLWWYGLGFALGFLHLHLHVRRVNPAPGLEHSWLYPEIDTAPPPPPGDLAVPDVAPRDGRGERGR